MIKREKYVTWFALLLCLSAVVAWWWMTGSEGRGIEGSLSVQRVPDESTDESDLTPTVATSSAPMHLHYPQTPQELIVMKQRADSLSAEIEERFHAQLPPDPTISSEEIARLQRRLAEIEQETNRLQKQASELLPQEP